LANISARAQTLLHEEHDPQRRRKLAAIHTQALRAHEMIADMMLFARPPQPKLAAVDLARLLAEVVEELAPAAAAQQTELLLHASAEAARLEVSADKTQLAVAVRALATNSLEALGREGRIELSLDMRRAQSSPPVQSAGPDDSVQITVCDDGPGIPAEMRRHIFDPFYSGREAGRGLGFGLSKCWRIVSMHGGRIDVESRPGHTVFTLNLPARRPQ
jgi:signal transduction histidine kinase